MNSWKLFMLDGQAIVQFEDFQMKWAFETLERYHKRFCMFNDDIQGTAGVALAGILGSVRAQGQPLSNFVNQKIVVVGAGRAWCSENGHPGSFKDGKGLVTTDRNNLDPAAAPFAKNPRDLEGLTEGASIIEVVKKVRPHVLLGLSGVGGIFNEENVSTKPAIFAMSNPTMNAECTAIDAFKHAGGDIVFGSGSPFENVDLGSLLSGARLITDGILQAAAECLASYMLEEDISKGILYPSIDSTRNVTAEVGVAVLRAAVEDNLAEGHGDVGPKELAKMSKRRDGGVRRKKYVVPCVFSSCS
ncbi:NAD-dependent malic enzyme 2 [Arachis hypogaea]|nr:NAD-dependent malic enzyme 2 [Arachis hypogaea]